MKRGGNGLLLWLRDDNRARELFSRALLSGGEGVITLLQTEGGGAGLYLLTQFIENVIIF